METFYAPLLHPRTHAPIFPGLERGGELIWGAQAANGGMVAQSAYGRGAWLGDAAFQDPTWNYKTFDFDAGLARADQLDAGLMTLTPDLQKYLARGGRLLHYHGWSDPGISPRSSIDYYNSVLKAAGRATDVRNSSPPVHGARYGSLLRRRRCNLCSIGSAPWSDGSKKEERRIG